MKWLQRMWMPVAIVIINIILFGLGPKFIPQYFGNSLDDLCTLIWGLSACFAAIMIIDFAFDKRDGWGIFPTLNLDQAIKNAQGSRIGSGLVWLGYVILLCTILFVAVPRAHGADAMLAKAKPYLPQVTTAINECWPTHPVRHHPAGKIERESGWNPKATLKTSREWGRGFSQATIAWDKNGKERFNSFRDAMNFKQLRGWNWEADPFNTQYHIKLVVLRDRSSFNQIRNFMVNDVEAMKVVDVMYNAGGGRYNARKIYARLHGFKADRWTGGLELAHGPKEDVLLYGRPLWKAVNEYPVLVARAAERYKGLV